MKILVIQTAFPGDAVLTLPLIQEIQKKYSHAQIDVLCIPSTAIIFQASPAVNKTIEFDKRQKDAGFFSLAKLIKKIRSENYDIIYSPHRSARSAVITYFSSPNQSYSFNKSSLGFLYKNKVEYGNDWHEVKRNLSLLNDSYENDKWKILPRVIISDEQKKSVDEKLNQVNYSKLIAIAPGSVWETKRYPVEYFKDIADKLSEQSYSIALIGSKEDFILAEKIKTGNSKIYNFSGEFSFIQSVYLISKAELLISNDSAPTHLAMCADIPVLTIYCSTVPDFGFYPYNKKSDYISYDKLDCKPCGIHGYHKCPEGHFKCGYKLSSETILSKALAMLRQGHSHHN